MTNRKKAKQSLTRKQFEAIQSKLNKVLMESRITPLQAIHVLCGLLAAVAITGADYHAKMQGKSTVPWQEVCAGVLEELMETMERLGTAVDRDDPDILPIQPRVLN